MLLTRLAFGTDCERMLERSSLRKQMLPRTDLLKEVLPSSTRKKKDVSRAKIMKVRVAALIVFGDGCCRVFPGVAVDGEAEDVVLNGSLLLQGVSD